MSKEIYVPIEFKNLLGTPNDLPEAGNLFLYPKNGTLNTLDASGNESLIGGVDGSIYVNAKFLEKQNFSSDVSVNIPANYRIVSILFEESGGDDASINVGTTSGGNDIVNEEVLNANSYLDAAIGQSVFGIDQVQTVYVTSPNWGTSVVDMYIRLENTQDLGVISTEALYGGTNIDISPDNSINLVDNPEIAGNVTAQEFRVDSSLFRIYNDASDLIFEDPSAGVATLSSLLGGGSGETYFAGENIEITVDNSINLVDNPDIAGTLSVTSDVSFNSQVYIPNVTEASTANAAFFDTASGLLSYYGFEFINLTDTPDSSMTPNYNVIVNTDGTALDYTPLLWEESNNEVTLADPSYNAVFYSFIELEQDAGLAVFSDKNVTELSSVGTEESYTMDLDSSSYFKIYGLSDGSGNIQGDAGAAALEYMYIGDPASDPSTYSCFRMYVKDASDAMIVERRKLDGTWVESGIFT